VRISFAMNDWFLPKNNLCLFYLKFFRALVRVARQKKAGYISHGATGRQADWLTGKLADWSTCYNNNTPQTRFLGALLKSVQNIEKEPQLPEIRVNFNVIFFHGLRFIFLKLSPIDAS